MSIDHATAPVVSRPPKHLDYSLTGEETARAIERGLAEADWYQCPVPRATMRQLLERKDGPAIRDTVLWFTLIFASGAAVWWLWPSWWVLLPYFVYATLYATTSDPRWHEAGHGTAFKTDWMNNALYEVASFMVRRESTIWRWSHTRHHSDTVIVGRDPEIQIPRPPDLRGYFLGIFNVGVTRAYFKNVVLHSLGRMTDDEKTYVPASEFGKVFLRARVHLAIYVATGVLAWWTWSLLPILYVWTPHFIGTWLMMVYNTTQHAGLAENVLDHRLNCRTVLMNRVNRWMYWNMNYHVEHHMFPLVPYHALPRLHEAIKHDCPPVYNGLREAWAEIIPTTLKQVKDPAYYVKRKLPSPAPRPGVVTNPAGVGEPRPDAEGWIEVCAGADLGREDALRYDLGRKTFAIYRDHAGKLFATDGICTHGNTHLADGLVKDGQIECPKHNGRFNLADGSPARAPVCRGIATYPVEERSGRLWLNIARAGGAGARALKTYTLRVKSSRCVSTFIREIELEAVGEVPAFTPGDYLQIEIPAYEEIRFADFDVPEPYRSVWQRQHVFDLVARNPGGRGARRNNYSLASCASTEPGLMRFNVRIATPPPGQDCPPGVGSAYMWSLKPGDTVSAEGPFGDFHVKPTQREMVYIGGGAGMAPLRAHLAHLFETEKTQRRVSFWYGARSMQELFYDDYFKALEDRHPNFTFKLALSSPLPEDAWTGYGGFIHEVVLDNYLKDHPNPKAVEFYLCGPPMMIKACTKMLADLGVPANHIAFDEF